MVMTVMLVDDSDIARALLRTLLAEIDTVSITGEFAGTTAAIAGIRNDPPDIILLDIQLEDGCGMDVLKVVSSEYPRTTFIVVSNHADRVFREHYAHAGAYRFFDKSRELDALRRCLAELSAEPRIAIASTVANGVANNDSGATASELSSTPEIGGIAYSSRPRKAPIALIVDDDPFIRLLTRDALERFAWQVEEANDGTAGLAAVMKLQPDIVLLDVMMPGMDGFEVCRALRKVPGGELIPVLMLTGRDDAGSIEQAYQAGATDFISKPINYAILGHRVRYMLQDITERKHNERRIHRLANYDALTDLPNRNLLNDRVAQAIALARRSGLRLAMLCLDLDGFKFINDSFGHAAGDALLKMVGARLQASIRECDTVARLGGDEFIILLPGVGQGMDVSVLAQKVAATFAEKFIVDGRELRVTASIGVSVFPEDGELGDALLKNADVAMYSAKEKGRNRYQFYAQEMSQHAEQRVVLENALRTAVERQEFEVYYQPKVDVRSSRVSGVEALIRWRRPGVGLVAPDAFIPLAEETGLIVPIGEWVLRTACTQIRQWHCMGYRDLTMAVNLSARQFEQQNIAELVRRVLADTGLAAKYLELELTESVLMHDSERMQENLRQLKEVGVLLTLDDFGTGYSSLSYLMRFPIDVLKIDRSFIQDVTTEADDAALTKGIILLAQSLKMKTVAEGVETEGQLGFLRTHKCDAVQGYYFSRPVPAQELVQLLRARQNLPVLDEPSRARQTILLLGDERNVINSLSRLFRPDDYYILTAGTPAEAFELLALYSVQVIISDQRMPLMTGTEFLGKVKEMYPDTIRIILSGYSELASVIDAINYGTVHRFFLKPWDDHVLRDQIHEAFHYYWVMQGRPLNLDSSVDRLRFSGETHEH